MPFSGDTFQLYEIRKHSLGLISEIKQLSIRNVTEHLIPLEQLEADLEQFFDISERLEIVPEILNSEENNFDDISELGDFGLQLLAELEMWTDAASYENNTNLQISILSLAIWIHDHHGILKQLENVVNALAQLANHTNESNELVKLHKIAEKITNSAHEVIKADVDKSEPGRVWRILNLNHGIIATRTHNIDIMQTVFEQLLMRLPEDATDFFADGIKQMDIIGYPEHVKHVMEHFYQLTNKPTLH